MVIDNLQDILYIPHVVEKMQGNYEEAGTIPNISVLHPYGYGQIEKTMKGEMKTNVENRDEELSRT
jgi:hypothetical protein